MAELLAKLQILEQSTESVHWFCPRQVDGNLKAYSDPGIQGTVHGEDGDTKPSLEDHKRMEEADRRRELVLDCLLILAYDGEDVAQHQEYLKRRLDKDLGRCDACIRGYYRGKRELMQRLNNDYEEEEVVTFSKILDDRDIRRIKHGLLMGMKTISALPAEEHNVNALGFPATYALFEALSCETFLQDESLLHSSFDDFFRLIQKKKLFRPAGYVPATTLFLFDSDEFRRRWARHNWARFPQGPTVEEFEWTIRDALLHNLRLAATPGVDTSHVERLWQGVKVIVDKLDKELITHSLRAMDIDVCRLALEHLQLDTPGFINLLQTIRVLLEKSPGDFWDAMGAISPTTVIEQIFNNPRYERTLIEMEPNADSKESNIENLLSWIEPFMYSLKTAHRPPACRSLVFQLIDRLQAGRFAEHVRVECYRQGLGVLKFTLQSFVDDSFTIGSVGRVVLSDTLEVVGSHIKGIMHVIKLPADYAFSQHLSEACSDIIRNSLAIECKSLRADYESLEKRKSLPHGASSYSPLIWDEIVNNLDPGNVTLARATLLGITGLVGLEKVSTKGKQDHLKERNQFNSTYNHLTYAITQVLERLGDFAPEDIDKLFTRYETADALIASLFSADANAYQAAINLIKNVSAESGRKEAMAHLLRSFFITTLRGLSWSVRRISNDRTFASTPRLLRTCTDVLDILCNTQDGILRSRELSGPAQIILVEKWWENQWRALTVIFEMTEVWNNRGNDKETMMEFCRDTMQFAERLFEQYGIFSAVIDSAAGIKQESGFREPGEAGKALLKHPTTTMNAMVKWLRLRDEYLASTSVKLITMILRRLGERQMKIDEDAYKFITGVVAAKDPIRTMLTLQEKAELGRAVHENQGQSGNLLSSGQGQVQYGGKQSMITAWTKTAGDTHSSGLVVANLVKKPRSIDTKAQNSRSKTAHEIIEIPDENEFTDPDIADEDLDFLSLTPTAQIFKSHPLSTSIAPDRSFPPKSTSATANMSKAAHAPKARGSEAERRSFREKREKEKEAKRLRDAQELARLKKKLAPLRGVAEQTAEEGSGLKGIGVKGKDHAPKGSSMMISSDSDTDSEDDLDRELFGDVSKGPKPSDAFIAYQESKAQSMRQVQHQGPVKKSRQIRSAKDMRARLAPDLSSLHKTILGWDFFYEGDFPPSSERDDYSLVSTSFDNPVEYQSTFEPLLILEAWQGFMKAKEEGNFKTFDIKVANRLTVDSFIEVSTTMSTGDGKELGVGEADIILMSKSHSPAMDSQQPHCLARVSNVTRKKNTFEISYRVNVRNELVSAMIPNASLFGVKLTSITPLEREYGGLVGLKYYDLCDEIIKAKPSPLLGYSEKQIDPIINNYQLNHAQAMALRSAMDNDAFTLIQGPPGSGKTKTIVAIVGAILTDTFRDKGVAITRPQVNPRSDQPYVRLSTSKKLLVCAPSNAAVDELVIRLKRGVKTLKGELQTLSIVRLGRSDAINSSVLDVTLDELVNARLNPSHQRKTDQGDDVHKIMMEHKSTSAELLTLRTRLDECKAQGKPIAPELERDFDLLKRKKNQLSLKIDVARDKGNTAARDADINRRRVQQNILNDANVICATLSGSGHEMFQNFSIEFETVVIDEAAQSIELSALIPLKYGCSKCIMVGDPKQLPPTVLSREAARFQYEQSLFVRMQNNHPEDVHLLDTQYRMHPEISQFPSRAFYDGKLLDGPHMARLRNQPWHESNILGPYRFFDVQGAHQSAPKGHSLINVAEVEVALQLFDRLITDYGGFDFREKVGVITPYKSQLRELRARFARKYGDTVFSTVEFNTTDAFQGRESEIIIFSCVRASSTKGIGFLADIRRMNVGLTRAKSSLWVLGNSQSLLGGEFWARLIHDARARECYTSGDVLTILRQPLVQSDKQRSIEASRSAIQHAHVRLHSDEDVEMTDIGTSTILTTGDSALTREKRLPKTGPAELVSSRLPPDRIMHSHTSGMAHPSGGRNGLDANKTCNMCGSFAHQTWQCDHKQAQAANSTACYRCGDPSHQKMHCYADRCLDCGRFGHTSKCCTASMPLSNWEREGIKRAEAKHQFSLQNTSERQRKRQLGEHDATVPVIRTTRKTPPPEPVTTRTDFKPRDASSAKRKREPSPPLGISGVPMAIITGRSGTTPKHPDRLSSTGNLVIPSEDLVPLSKGNSRIGDRNQGLYSATQKTDRSSLPNSKPTANETSSIVNSGPNQLGSASNGSHEKRPGNPRHNLIHPPTQKKSRDVDPFIRPKRRKPRS